ncbi:2-nitropropane dioxygenase [Gymnopilus junonius]|uniref:2-nitropropane dioxygenase n=1 Tax=Gymnopilus junonius TaxID=109634 RepID=A0A9P5NKB7_GYMJU|nr:2-nitropropane dioxygenase [Gymnopilus junonius]
MPSIKTPLTELLNVDVPIISAPMATAATPELAAAVTSAGGFGMIGAGVSSSKTLKGDIERIRNKLRIDADKPVPIGVGMLGWVLDAIPEQSLEAVLDEKPVAVWLAFGSDLGKYVTRIRVHDSKCSRKTIVFVIVNSVEMALKAADDWKVDVIVVQGIEAGGHGGARAPPLFDLLPAILDAVPNGPLVVGAGGISNGSQIAALLTLGAHGVVLGTRFLFTPECQYSSQQKEILLKAGLNDTTRSLAFDEVARLDLWPHELTGRAISNNIIEDLHDGLDLETRLKKYDESAAAGDTSRLIVWAGVGAGLVKNILPAAEIVSELRKDTVAYLKGACKLAQISEYTQHPLHKYGL